MTDKNEEKEELLNVEVRENEDSQNEVTEEDCCSEITKKLEELKFELESKNSEIETLKSDLDETTKSVLYKKAELDNTRKRLVREKDDAVKFSNENLLKDLLDIIDNFERAIKSTEESKDFQALHDGVIMIEKQFKGMLESKYNLKIIESVGNEFNPQIHEAMMIEESEDHEVSMVLEDYQTGYMLNERVLRPSKVKVTKPVQAE